jgi:hypothetical protein
LNDTWKLVDGNWTRVAVTRGPPATYGASAAYDPQDGYVVMVGGCILSVGCPKETWTFAGGNWTKTTPSPAPSPSLEWAALAYDAKDGYLVLFGGSQAVAGGSFDTNYTWTYAGGNWTNITPRVSPSPRYGAAMDYDALHGHLVLFGGGSRFASCGYAGTCPLNDTWTFSGGRWSRSSPSTEPHARYAGAMAYDSKLGCSVLFGGFGAVNSGGLNDTWEYCHGTWSNISPVRSPVVQYTPAMIYDGRSHLVIMFGSHYSRRAVTWTFG